MGTRQNRDIATLVSAIEKTEMRLQEMDKQAKGACCPSCFWGKDRNVLIQKQINRLSWLKILAAKNGIQIPQLPLWLFDYNIK